MVPDFVGDNVQTEVRSGATYWGRNPFKLNHEYAGFIPLLLLPILFLRRRNGQTIFFTVLAALALLYALGANTPPSIISLTHCPIRLCKRSSSDSTSCRRTLARRAISCTSSCA